MLLKQSLPTRLTCLYPIISRNFEQWFDETQNNVGAIDDFI